MRRSNKNRTYVTGLVTQGPDLEVENGTTVLHMQVRSRRFRMKAGEEVEYFDLLEVDMHGANAERAAERVSPHTVVEVVGRLEARQRPVMADGQFVYERTDKGRRRRVTYPAVTIVASRIRPLSSPSTAQETPSDENQPADEPASEAPEAQAS